MVTGLIATSAFSAGATIGGRVIEVIADKDNRFKVRAKRSRSLPSPSTGSL
jgi:hypothetical protein